MEGATRGEKRHTVSAAPQTGDLQAREREFEKLYLESYTLVYNYIFYRMAGDSAVEDIVAEAYLLAARSFGRFDPKRSKFSTWVTSIAINCMKDHYRKVKPTAAIEDVSETAIAVQGGQEAVDDRELVRKLLEVLDENERELVYLKYYQGMRNVDIAKDLNMNASTVSTKLANALAKMRAAMEKRSPR